MNIMSDPFAGRLGIRFREVRPGYALVEMPVAAHLCNPQGAVHRAAVFTAADVAFSAASNAGGTAAVALSVTINYLNFPAVGSVLTAEAVEESTDPKMRLYRVKVVDEKNEPVALFEGLVYRREE